MLKKSIFTEPVLVGREQEIEQLQRYFNSAAKGEGTAVFISGEAGSGKTRLIKEFLKTAQKNDVTVLTGWCLSDSTIPYFPFIEAFDSFSANITQKVGLQAWLLETGQSLVGEKTGNMQPEAWKDQVFYKVTKELLFLSAKKPLILILEDIHWADSASVSLIHYLARQVISERILIVATYRKEELNIFAEGHLNHLSNVLLLLGRDDLSREVELENLSVDNIGKIAKNMLGGNVQLELVEKLAADSHGNPLFIVESLRMLYQQGRLSKKKDQWSLSVQDFDVPRKVRDVILRRLETLKPYQRKILDVASVVGEKFNPEIIAAAVSGDNADVLIALSEIAKHTLMVRTEDKDYRFEHAKFREMLYEEIHPILRREYHRRIAEELEVTSQNGIKVSASDLAHHFFLADNKTKTVKYSLNAGKTALAQFSNLEAIKHFLNVLSIAKNNGEFTEEKSIVLESLGDAYAANCMYADAIKIFDKLAENEKGTVQLRAIRKAMDAAFLKGDKPDLLLAYAKKAEELAIDDRLEMARIINNRARAFAWAGRGDPKMDIADHEAALQVFEEENSLADIAEALWRSGEALTHTRGRDIDRLLRSRVIFRELGDIRKEIAVTRSVAFGFNSLELFPESRQELANVLRIGGKLGLYSEVARAYGILSLMDEIEGKLPEALSKILKALEYCERTDANYIRGLDLAAFTRIYSKLGDLKHADEYFDRMIKLPPEVLSQALVSIFIPASKGVYFAAKGKWKEANQIFETPALKSGVLPHLREYTWALEKEGRIEEARDQRNRVEKLSKQTQKRFKNANLRLSILAPDKVYIGEEFEMRLDIVNIARNPGTLSEIEGLIPSGCKAMSLPSSFSMQNGSIKTSNLIIGPFQVETIKLRAAFAKASIYNLNPAISYVDNLGKTRRKKVKPVTITVKLGSIEDKSKSTSDPLEAQFEFKSKAAEKAFNFLVKAFKEDYIANKMAQEKSGWRTLMQVVRNAPVTMHGMYGRTGKGGKATLELERLGLAEQRFFLGERGRGGRVLKMRICYEKEPVKLRVR